MRSSTNSTHLNSISRAFFSTWRYSGIWIFQGRANTLGSANHGFFIRLPPSLAGLFAELAIHEILDEFHALEFHQPRILFDVAVQRHLDFPGTREYLGIREPRLFHQTSSFTCWSFC